MSIAREGRNLQSHTSHLNAEEIAALETPRRDARAEVNDDDQMGPLPGHPEVVLGRQASLV